MSVYEVIVIESAPLQYSVLVTTDISGLSNFGIVINVYNSCTPLPVFTSSLINAGTEWSLADIATPVRDLAKLYNVNDLTYTTIASWSNLTPPNSSTVICHGRFKDNFSVNCGKEVVY